MQLKNSTYDLLKKIVTTVIPAFFVMFNGLCIVWQWDLPVEAIDASVGLVTTFLGVLLNISSKNYNKAKS